ncbi:Repeat domain-containing protein [Pseudoxanthomonas sp. CF385]|nr:Repeat domain-containing protein [Pseudoxanthomonas sp. CF385]
MRGVAASGASGALKSPLPTARPIGKSIANAPDRGQLISYANKGEPTKREGAYTWYPIAISEAHAFRGLASGEMTVPTPEGGQVKVRYERHAEEIDGNWTWIGRVVGGDPLQEAIITFGEKAVFGSIPMGKGKLPLSLQTRQGQVFAVETDPSLVVSANTGHVDMLVPEASQLRAMAGATASQSAAVSQGAVAVAQGAPQTAANTIDVAIGYTPEFAADNGGASGAATRLVYLIQVGNQAFTNSQINGYLRIVNAVQVSYTNSTANATALNEVTGSNGSAQVAVPPSLVPLRTARDQYGADIAILVRKFTTPENAGCGVAWLNGAGAQNGGVRVSDAPFGYAVISDGYDQGTDGKTYYCADETLVHEAGHLMGAAHDRANSKINPNNPPGGTNLLYGAYTYSFGLNTDAANGNFFTLDAYGDEAGGDTPYRVFSNPNVTICGGRACGVANSEDNARTLNQTIPVVAQFRATVVPIVGSAKNDINGDGKDDLVWHNATLSSYGYWLLDGAGITHAPNVPSAPGLTIAAQGDFTADGRMDLVWQSPQRDLYFVPAGASGFGAGVYIGTYPAGWKVVAAGDVDGDGRADLIWHNATTREYGYWIMNGATRIKTYSTSAAAGYNIATVGDFNGDGRLDLVWVGPTNDIILLTGNGNTFTDAKIGNYPDAGRIFASGDVNGDGRDDLLIHNKVTNQWGYWLMNGAAISGSRGFSAAPGYSAVSVGDYNGDGIVDVIWSSAAKDLQMLAGNGSTFVHVTLGSYSGDWKPIDKSVNYN